jgi:hypothetical protein
MTLTFYLTYCLVIVVGARSFRKHPDRSRALGYFRGDLPHNILGRAIVFKHGSPDYDADLLDWAFHSKTISDRYWNRWILESNIEAASETERLRLLPRYPLTPTKRLVPFLKKALDADRYQVLPLLGKADGNEAPAVYRSWVNERVIKPHNTALFSEASGYIVESGTVPLTELLKSFWPIMKPNQQQLVFVKIGAHVPDEPTVYLPLFDWARSNAFKVEPAGQSGILILMGRFLSFQGARERALTFIGQNAGKINGKKADLLLYFIPKAELRQVASQILDRVKNQNDEAVLSIIHHVAHDDITVAEDVATPFLSVGDSEIRKGVIVVLLRHGSTKGRAIFDQAFTGTAPRKTMFIYSETYENGNAAADLYCRLATHAYRQTGKTWPPAYFGQRPSADEILRWREFIKSYPWFPGTDDAYYRLAFSQFAQKDYSGCFATIKEYLAREYWPDNDVRPYMMHLLRNLVVVSDIADAELPAARHLRTIATNPLAPMMIGTHEKLSDVLESLNWFISNPGYLRFINSDVRTVKIMRDVAEQIASAPPDSVCRLVAARLERENPYGAGPDSDLSSSQPNADDLIVSTDHDDAAVQSILRLCSTTDQSTNDLPVYPASIIESTLYGIFNDFPPPESSSARIAIPEDPGDLAIHQVASFLNEQFATTSLNAISNGSNDEILALASLHSGKDFERWRGQFGPTLNGLTALNLVRNKKGQ